MLRSIIIGILTIIFCSGCANTPVEDQFLYSCAGLDRALIPAYIFTQTSQKANAQKAVLLLNEKWGRFIQLYYNLELKHGVDIIDKDWKSDFNALSTMMLTAESYVMESKLLNTEQKIREVRARLKDLRKRNGIDYYPDILAEIDEQINQLAKISGNKNKLVQAGPVLLADISKRLVQALSNEVKSKYFDFDDKKAVLIKQKLEILGKKIKLIDILALDPGQILTIQKDFWAVYKLFGDFKPFIKPVVKAPKKPVEKPAKKGYNKKTKGKKK